MRLICGAVLTVAAANMALAQGCPAPAGAPVWHQFGCEAGVGSMKTPDTGDSVAMTIAVLEGLAAQGRVSILYFQSSGDEIVAGLDALLENAGAAALSPEEARRIDALTETSGDPVSDAELFMEQAVAARGKHLVNIETSSNYVTYAIMDDALFCRWNRVRLASGIWVSQISAVGVDDTYFDTQYWPEAPRDCGAMTQ